MQLQHNHSGILEEEGPREPERASLETREPVSQRASPLFICMHSGGIWLLSPSQPRLLTIALANYPYGPSLLLPNYLIRSLSINLRPD